MGSGNWYKVDNVSKVFLATVGKRDTRSFRLSCTLKEEVDPELLQQAVESAIEDRPQVQVRIRRGIFWHYMEDIPESVAVHHPSTLRYVWCRGIEVRAEVG